MRRKREAEKPVKKFTEDEIQTKLYGGEKKPRSLLEKKEPVTRSQEAINRHIKEEMDDLKDEIIALEERLKKTESQKERLKKKLVSRRVIDNFINQSLPAITHKMPEKIIIIIPVAVIILLFVIVLNLRHSEVDSPETVVIEKEVVEKPIARKVGKPKQKTSIVDLTPINTDKKYTLQVAEYALLEAAERFVSDLEAKGFEVVIDTIYRGNDKSKPYYKINAGFFATYNEAKKFKEAFFRATGIKDAFVKEKR